MIPSPGMTFTIMGVLSAVIFLWYFWSEQETGMSTAEIIAESHRKHGLDV